MVIDTNAFGGGNFDLRRITGWAEELARHGIPLWLPEVVAWELAEHLAAEYQRFWSAGRQHRKSVVRAGRAMPEPEQFDALAHIINELKQIDSVEIIPLDGDSAREAIADQVLARPPGTRHAFNQGKRTVKSGAADSAIIRSVIQHAGDPELSDIAIVSGDGDIAKGLETLVGTSAKIYVSTQQLLEELRQRVRAEQSAKLSIHTYLSDVVLGQVHDDPHDPYLRYEDGPVSIGAELQPLLGHTLPDGPEFALETSRWIEDLTDILAIEDVQADAEDAYLWADVTFLGGVRSEYWVWDDVDDALVQAESDWTEVCLRATLRFDLDEQAERDEALPGSIADVVNETDVVTVWPVHRDDDGDVDDALAELATTVAAHIGVDLDTEELTGEILQGETPAGVEVTLNVTEPYYPDGEDGEWIALVSIGDTTLEFVAIDAGQRLSSWRGDIVAEQVVQIVDRSTQRYEAPGTWWVRLERAFLDAEIEALRASSGGTAA